MSILSTLTSIFRSRTRSLLTMAGIAVGVFSVVLVSTVGTIGTQEVSSTLVTMGVDTLLVQAANKSVSVTLTDDEIIIHDGLDTIRWKVGEATPEVPV